MSSVVLNLFPSRVAIGKVRVLDPATQREKELPVMMSSEFERALGALFVRVGGAVADSNSDLSVISLAQDAPPAFGNIMNAVADLQRDLASASALVAQVAQLRARVADLEREIVEVQRPTDWDHPGTIGGKTPGAGSFTNITYSGQLASTIGAGTAPMVVTSDTKVINLNVDKLDGTDWTAPGTIGGVTPGSATFTSLTATGAVSLSPANANVVASPTGTGTVTIAPATAGSINNVSIGAVTPQNGTFKSLQTDGTANVLLGTDATSTDTISRGVNSGVGGGAAQYVRVGGVAVIGIGNKSRLNGGAYDGTPYFFSNAVVEFSNGARFNGNMGFYGAAAVAKPTVTGSRGGNAALASLLTALANFGLLTDSST